MAGKLEGITVTGTEEITELFKKIAPKHARNLMRSVNQALATELKNRIKAATPSNTGNLKRSLKAKRVQSTPEKPISDVIFESKKGAKADGYYWRFVEHGTTKGKKGSSSQPARPFVAPTRERFAAEMPTLTDQLFIKKLVALINREKKKAAKKK